MKCPIDDSPLSVSAREGVEIDFCPQCRGVWLDRGELDKIIDRVATTLPATSAPVEPLGARRDDRDRDDRFRSDDHNRYGDRDRDRDRDDRSRGNRKRRSFLDDLFDFD